MPSDAPSSFARASLASLDEVAITRAPNILANCSAKIDTPPVPCTSTVSPAMRRPCSTSACHAVTPAQGKRRAFLIREIVRQLHRAVFLQHDIFRQHAINAAAQRIAAAVRRRDTRRPALIEIPGNTIADFHTRDAWSHLNDFARAVRQRNEIRLGSGPIAPQRNGIVAVVQRTGRDLDQYLPVARLRLRQVNFGEIVNGGRLFELIGAHEASPRDCLFGEGSITRSFARFQDASHPSRSGRDAVRSWLLV